MKMEKNGIINLVIFISKIGVKQNRNNSLPSFLSFSNLSPFFNDLSFFFIMSFLLFFLAVALNLFNNC